MGVRLWQEVDIRLSRAFDEAIYWLRKKHEQRVVFIKNIRVQTLAEKQNAIISGVFAC